MLRIGAGKGEGEVLEQKYIHLYLVWMSEYWSCSNPTLHTRNIANVIGFLSLHSGIDLMCYYYHSKVNPCQTCATVLSRCIAVKKNTDIFACFEILQNCKTPNNDTHFKFRYAIDISSAIASPGMKLMFTKWSCQLF